MFLLKKTNHLLQNKILCCGSMSAATKAERATENNRIIKVANLETICINYSIKGSMMGRNCRPQIQHNQDQDKILTTKLLLKALQKTVEKLSY